MGNRADRRAAIKIARQAIRRAKTPLEAAILRSAMAFATDRTFGDLGALLSHPDFDPAWDRILEDLESLLDDDYDEFALQAYVEAGATGPADDGALTRLVLCPLVGTRAAVEAFAADAPERMRLAASLRESGIVPEAGRCRFFPALVPMAALASNVTLPGVVRALHDALLAIPAAAADAALPTLPFGPVLPAQAAGETVMAALVGIERVPLPRDADFGLSDEALDAEDMALAATHDSWHDSYPAERPDLRIGPPLDWPGAAAALAFESIRVAIEAARRRAGLREGPVEVIHWAPSADETRVVMAAAVAGRPLGPFSVPISFAFFDPDTFFDRAAAAAEELVEHEDEAMLLGLVFGAG